MTPKDIDTEYEAWKADAEPIFDGKPAKPMTADECAEALSVAEYTAECFFSGSITELADDPTFKRLVKLARAAEWDTVNALAKLNEAQAEVERLREQLDARAKSYAQSAHIAWIAHSGEGE